VAEIVKFVVHGAESTTRSAAVAHGASLDVPGGLIKRSVQLSRQRAGGSEIVLEAVKDEDVVVIHIEDGPVLVLHPEHARDLLRAQSGGGMTRGSTTTQSVPGHLQWADLRTRKSVEEPQQRGDWPKALISAIDIVSGKLKGAAAGWTADQVVRLVDDQVTPGLYRLNGQQFTRTLKDSGAEPSSPAAAADGTILVLIHGTFSNTYGTFQQLWAANPDVVRTVFANYGDRVYGLEHETLGTSPVANALMLIRALPKGACLHLLTHSRGGLVAEVLARACSYKFQGAAALAEELKDAFPGTDYDQERKDLQQLILAVSEREIRVERVVRVACPARGTLLASGRLDAYLSILKWTMSLAGVPVLPELVEFLGAVAQHRTNPEQIPGLAAQMPDSPLIEWLHAVDEAIDGQLRVVAGDIQGETVVSWLKTLVSDGFYWTDNDFVVQTSSMYGGAPRAAGATFVLERNGKVSHFSYFKLQASAQAICNALTQSEPTGFNRIGPLSWSGRSSEGYRAAPQGDRPVVFLLPGILGSNLKVDGKRIWMGLRMLKGFDQLKYGVPDSVEPDGAVEYSYARLIRFLSATHDVVEFAYDWRKPMELEARRLADEVEAALSRREASGQPVRLLAHSMGGLLVRTMILERPATWQRLQSRAGARFVMLGTPNGGSWAPMQVLSGDDTFGNALVALSSPLREGEARAIMAQFPGFLQLQAGLLDGGLMLHSPAEWSRLAEKDYQIVRENSFWHSLARQLRAFRWGIPGQDVLQQAVNLRKRLDKDAAILAVPSGLVALVVGHAEFTPDGYEFDEGGLQYREAGEGGDGRVMLTSAMLPGVPAWSVRCEHGSLADDESAFNGYLDLLQTGTTTRLEQARPPTSRDGAPAAQIRHRLRRAARTAPGITPDLVVRMPSDTREQFALAADEMPTLRVRVTNGNLKFVRQPMLVGHYSSLTLTGSEDVLNRLTGGSMAKAIGMGCYPSALCTHQLFTNIKQNEANPLQLPRPEAVIVVGLGREGELKPAQLADTVCRGVVAWAQRLVETSIEPPGHFDIATTLIGSGGANVTAGLSARAVAQGVSRANMLLRAAGWPTVRELDVIELFADRAAEAWNALNLLSQIEPNLYRIHDEVVPGTGPQRRSLESAYRGAGYDLISALSDGGSGKPSTIVYSLNTRRAREDVRAQRTQLPLIDMLVKAAATAANSDTQLGRTLFQLLVPPEVEPFLAGSTDMQIELNDGTSGIPWELLDTSGQGGVKSNEPPWAIRVKLLRRLRTVNPQLAVNDARSDAHILVIGEPQCDPSRYPPLPGARSEAVVVANTMEAGGYRDRVRRLISGDVNSPPVDASNVISTLLERDWRIVHIAGHGALPCGEEERGVVLSNDSYLGAVELSNMRTVPALVFINCCHLGAQSPEALLRYRGLQGEDLPHFAATVAGALIRRGVRCVLVAGWAVDDRAAGEFAKVFYQQLIGKARFIDAVAQARWAAYQIGGNTWAAYQCYGDPDWTLRVDQDAKPDEDIPAEEYTAISSAPALVLALETIVTTARFEDVPRHRTLARVSHLEQRFGARWQGIGVVAEAFSMAWAEADRLDDAIRWARLAREANDGSASLHALEQLGSLLARRAWQVVRPLWRAYAEKPEQSREALLKAVAEQESYLDEAIVLLTSLAQLQPTMERVALLGACWKRVAMHKVAAGSKNDGEVPIRKMYEYYAEAEQIGRQTANGHWFYPALNRMIAQLVGVDTKRAERWDSVTARELERELDNSIRVNPDFWNVAAVTELKLYGAIAAGNLTGVAAEVITDFTDLKRRVNTALGWQSILDQFDFVSTCPRSKPTGQEAQTLASMRQFLVGLVI